jgi:ketosteroid isomerase-like protein
MDRWKSSLSTLAVSIAVIGFVACGSSEAIPAQPSQAKEASMNDEAVTTPEQVFNEMDAAFSRKDVDGVVALFAEDATLESYLVMRVFDRKEGVCRGRAEIREVVSAIMKSGTPWGGHEPPIVRGNTLAVEFHTASSDSEKFSVDIIEVKDGKIQSLRAYAGWRPLAKK